MFDSTNSNNTTDNSSDQLTNQESKNDGKYKLKCTAIKKLIKEMIFYNGALDMKLKENNKEITKLKIQREYLFCKLIQYEKLDLNALKNLTNSDEPFKSCKKSINKKRIKQLSADAKKSKVTKHNKKLLENNMKTELVNGLNNDKNDLLSNDLIKSDIEDNFINTDLMSKNLNSNSTNNLINDLTDNNLINGSLIDKNSNNSPKNGFKITSNQFNPTNMINDSLKNSICKLKTISIPIAKVIDDNLPANDVLITSLPSIVQNNLPQNSLKINLRKCGMQSINNGLNSNKINSPNAINETEIVTINNIPNNIATSKILATNVIPSNSAKTNKITTNLIRSNPLSSNLLSTNNFISTNIVSPNRHHLINNSSNNSLSNNLLISSSTTNQLLSPPSNHILNTKNDVRIIINNQPFLINSVNLKDKKIVTNESNENQTNINKSLLTNNSFYLNQKPASLAPNYINLNDSKINLNNDLDKKNCKALNFGLIV